MSQLIARQFVREIGFDSSGGGRPAVLLELNPGAGCIVGGEIGHTTIMSDGERCNCRDRGCWETLASQTAVVNRVRKALVTGNASLVSQLVKGRLERISIPIIVEAAEEGDKVARQALEDTGAYLGIGIANLINAFNPELIIFGGIVSLASSYLLPAIEKALKERSLIWPRRMVRVMASSHGPEACIMGGVALVLHDILKKPALIT